MRAPYPIEIEIDGRKCRGLWNLKQGGKLWLSVLGYGAEHFDVAPSENPAQVARAKAALVVAAWKEERTRESFAMQREKLRLAKKRRQHRRRHKPMAGAW